jgi:hypothetical protein
VLEKLPKNILKNFMHFAKSKLLTFIAIGALACPFLALLTKVPNGRAITSCDWVAAAARLDRCWPAEEDNWGLIRKSDFAAWRISILEQVIELGNDKSLDMNSIGMGSTCADVNTAIIKDF